MSGDISIVPGIVLLAIGCIMLFVAVGLFTTADSSTPAIITAIISILLLIVGTVLLIRYLNERPSNKKCNATTECPSGEYCSSNNICVAGIKCSSQAQCPAGQVCQSNGVCVPMGFCTSTANCPAGTVCASNNRCVVPGGCTGTGSADCPTGMSCFNGKCSTPCTNNTGCGQGQLCQSGFCITPTSCTGTTGCGNGYACFQGSCIPGFQCNTLADCPIGGPYNACVSNVCQVVPTPLVPSNQAGAGLTQAGTGNAVMMSNLLASVAAPTPWTAVNAHPSGVINFNPITGATSVGNSGSCNTFSSQFRR